VELKAGPTSCSEVKTTDANRDPLEVGQWQGETSRQSAEVVQRNLEVVDRNCMAFVVVAIHERSTSVVVAK
jgi:hypothetical protein